MSSESSNIRVGDEAIIQIASSVQKGIIISLGENHIEYEVIPQGHIVFSTEKYTVTVKNEDNEENVNR